jgi:DNA (cytosine-5)-methyltransferase 1
MKKISVGSVCSGIEAASVAWGSDPFAFEWSSETAMFPSQVLEAHYPDVPNVGDMSGIPELLKAQKIAAPDLICGGTPCQAFSLAGWKKGLDDARGNLTLRFVDIVEENDRVRREQGQSPSIILWENVEGVLRDKTNAFGLFLASLAGLTKEIGLKKLPSAGLVRGPKRNVAWRVLDAKYFGVPQQRRRLYVLAGGPEFYPENVIFDGIPSLDPTQELKEKPLRFEKDGCSIQIFRSYTDCLYSAYGTKWNGNAAAYNGSLYVVQDRRLRRFSPLECERLMGFPDGYTEIARGRPTNRYQALGNSWAVPVVRWIGKRISESQDANTTSQTASNLQSLFGVIYSRKDCEIYDVTETHPFLGDGLSLNGSELPEMPVLGDLSQIVDVECPENFYISPVGCKGILRRKQERQLRMNAELEIVLERVSSKWSNAEIERVSRIQKRGRLSDASSEN